MIGMRGQRSNAQTRAARVGVTAALGCALIALGCAADPSHATSLEAPILGGAPATEPEHDAVVCVPEINGTGCIEGLPGWPDQCWLRCRTGTLITPQWVLTDRKRLVHHDGSTNPRQIAFGPDGRDPSFFAEGRCWELRRSGIHPCCFHPMDPDINRPRFYIPPEEDWTSPCAWRRAVWTPADGG